MRSAGGPATLLLFCLFFCCACDRSVQNENRYPEDVRLTKTYFEMLRTGNYDEVEKTVDRVGYGEDFRVTFDALLGAIPGREPLFSKNDSS